MPSRSFLRLLNLKELLAHSNMEAALLYLIFNIAQPLRPHITQHLAEDILERVAAYGSATRFIRRADCVIAIIAYIKGGTETVTALL